VFNATSASDRRPRGQPSPTRIALAVSGFALAIAAAVYSYDRKPSIWLSLVVFMLVADTLGRRVADVLEQPRRLQRLLYIALLPAASAAALYGIDAGTGRMWVAAGLAVPVGALAQAVLGRLFLPTVAREELPPARIHWELRQGRPRELELTRKGWRDVRH
jgi:hypothetical protein